MPHANVRLNIHGRRLLDTGLLDRSSRPRQGPTCARFLLHANTFFGEHGITVRAVVSDNAVNCIRSTHFQNAIETIGAKHLTIKPHARGQTGKWSASTASCKIPRSTDPMGG